MSAVIDSTIAAAAAVTFALRCLPFLGTGLVARMPRSGERFFMLCGYSIIGSLMAESIFGSLDSSMPAGPALTDVTLRLGCTAVAAFSMLRWKRPVLSLIMSFGLFCTLDVLFRRVTAP
ncbi:AzlD domain-containing protein [Sorangium sp. So ce381]|uniref:AzlD domain-containing protein n=1 Tax=Sorangium sp. So ce381 TaxID=3133307 RepID=UPI003F5C9F0B